MKLQLLPYNQNILACTLPQPCPPLHSPHNNCCPISKTYSHALSHNHVHPYTAPHNSCCPIIKTYSHALSHNHVHPYTATPPPTHTHRVNSRQITRLEIVLISWQSSCFNTIYVFLCSKLHSFPPISKVSLQILAKNKELPRFPTFSLHGQIMNIFAHFKVPFYCGLGFTPLANKLFRLFNV